MLSIHFFFNNKFSGCNGEVALGMYLLLFKHVSTTQISLCLFSFGLFEIGGLFLLVV
jgi:hypothetical protein